MRILVLFFLIVFLNTSVTANTSYFNQGLSFYEKKKFEKAKFKFEQDIVYNPKNEKSYLYLSKIFNKQKNKELEEKNLLTVILLNPKNEEATYNLALLKLEKSDYKESKKLVDQLTIFCKNFCQKNKKLKLEIEQSLKK